MDVRSSFASSESFLSTPCCICGTWFPISRQHAVRLTQTGTTTHLVESIHIQLSYEGTKVRMLEEARQEISPNLGGGRYCGERFG
jgi:hypothetical protein